MGFRLPRYFAQRVHDFRHYHPDRIADVGWQHWADRRYHEADPRSEAHYIKDFANEDACEPDGPIRFIGNKQIVDFFFINTERGVYIGWDAETKAIRDIRRISDRQLANYEAGI